MSNPAAAGIHEQGAGIVNHEDGAEEGNVMTKFALISEDEARQERREAVSRAGGSARPPGSSTAAAAPTHLATRTYPRGRLAGDLDRGTAGGRRRRPGAAAEPAGAAASRPEPASGDDRGGGQIGRGGAAMGRDRVRSPLRQRVRDSCLWTC